MAAGLVSLLAACTVDGRDPASSSVPAAIDEQGLQAALVAEERLAPILESIHESSQTIDHARAQPVARRATRDMQPAARGLDSSWTEPVGMLPAADHQPDEQAGAPVASLRAGSDTNSLVVSGTSGADNLVGTADPDELDGLEGNDTLNGGASADVLNGGPGVDTASYSTAPGGVSVDLGTGTGTGSDAEGDILMAIENLRGSSFDDVLSGDSGANTLLGAGGSDTLNGQDGADTLVGGPGADVLDGGASIDWVSFLGAATGVVASLASGGSGGDAANDTYINIENMRGGNFDDVLIGDAGANTILGASGADMLQGGDGDDYLIGGLGGDALDGGAGADLASWASSTAGVIVNLTTGECRGGEAEGDTIIDIENLRGSNHGDVLIGNAQDNNLVGAGGGDVLRGEDGNDVLTGGVGADTLDGGPGEKDTVSYNGSPASVIVDLAAQTVRGGDADGDTIGGFECAVGSQLDDQLYGNELPNILAGLGGNDFIDGRGGVDTVDYATSMDAWTIDLAAGTAASSAGEGDTLVSMENAVGGQGNDFLYGTSGRNSLNGQEGNDVLDGRGDIDTADYSGREEDFVIDLAAGTATCVALGELDVLASIEYAIGGEGNDELIGDGGHNVLDGGPGADVIMGGGGIDVAAYTNAPEGVVASLLEGRGLAGEAAGDVLSGIEDLRGSEHGDTLIGDDAANVLTGAGGDDTVDGGGGNDFLIGGAGADTLIGGLGADMAVYAGSLMGVIVDLSLALGMGGDAEGDSYVSVDNLRGSEFGDTLIGDAGPNLLVGAGGDDVLDGRGGNDTMLGGAGNDRFRFQTGFGRDVISGFMAGPGTEDVLDVSALGYTSLAEILAIAIQSGDYVIITVDGQGVISLKGVTLAALSEDDFIFATP